MTAHVVVATGNRGKLREISAILAAGGVRLHALDAHDELPALASVVLPEEGGDYAANALAKAAAVAEQASVTAVADDSGLEVDALGGAPGAYSARYGGEGLDDAGRVAKLLAALVDVPDSERGARFYCVAALATAGGMREIASGECRGRILRAPRGKAGFGYDPVFQPEGHSESMAELTSRVKDALSHRGHAFRALAQTSSWLSLSPT